MTRPPRAKGSWVWRLPILLAVFGTPTLVDAAPSWGQEMRLSVDVDSIVVRGNERHSATRIIDLSGLRVGTRVQYPQVRQAIQRLFATGDFENVSIHVSPEPPNVFFIDVEERPYVTRYDFEGLEAVSASRVRDSVGLARNAPLEPDRIARAQGLMLRMLANEGFPRARVDTAMAPDPVRPSDYRITFRVAQGPRLGITEIVFEGNEAFRDGTLRGALGTRQEGFLWFRSGELKRDEYRRDLAERLPRFYASHGYLDFAVLGDTVVVDPETGKGRIVVRVDEGPQYLLEDFEITGNRRFPTERLEQLVRAGQREERAEAGRPPFNQIAFEEATGEVGDLYRNVGYLRAMVVPDLRRLPPEEEGGRPRVVASWNIQEGNPTYVREIRIVGNSYTHDRVIRNQLSIFPGDVYSQQRLIQSIQRIQGLGFFEPLPPQEAIEFRERPDGDIDLVLRVEERQTGTMNFGVSASGVTGVAGFIGYEQPNLFGQAKSGRFRWLFGGRQQDIEVSYSDPEVFGSARSATVTLRSSRDQFIGFQLGDRRQTGGFLEVGTPFLNLRHTRLFVNYSLFRDEVRGLDTAEVSPQTQGFLASGTRSGLGMRLVRDTRNNPMFPTAGNRNTLSARFTGGPLGGDGSYGKYELSSEWYVPVAQIGDAFEGVPIDIAGGITFSAGAITGDNPFFLERFFMGGTQIGQQLRGYEEATVTPRGHVPRDQRGFSRLDRVGESYFTTSAMIGARLTNMVFVSAFVDAGNVWARAADLNPTDLLVGAGVGVSLVTPFGPLGLDYAYGFDRRDVFGRPDPGWQLHFKFGRLF